MLHYGYFDNPNVSPIELSISDLEKAQTRYAEKIIDHIVDSKNPILDVGCGMGGLSEMIHKKGLHPECLTPNKNQIEFINKTFPQLTTYNCKFEEYQTAKKYGTIINSESLQYIPLKMAFEKVYNITLPQSRWIITDYFRISDSGINTSSHLMSDFLTEIKNSKWRIIYEEDITKNILPTLSYINLYVERFLKPIKHFAYEKLRYKKPKLYYMTTSLRESIDLKINKEVAAIDPNMFLREKKYMMFVLERD
jgi:hypothetical protein